MLTYADLTRDARAKLARDYAQLRGADRQLMLADAIERFGLRISVATLGREIRRDLRQAKPPPTQPDAPTPVSAPRDPDWDTWRRDVEAENRQLTIMHACDVHAPFHDETALGLFMRVVRAAQPDLVVVGSDFCDFYISSSFAHDGARYSDELDCVEQHWRVFLDDLTSAAPRAQLVFIWGNHERRLARYLGENAPAYQTRLIRDFVSIMRAGGRVWYAGEVDAVRVGYLQIEHGVRHGENAAKQRLVDLGMQVNVMAGHVHRFGEYVQRGARYTVRSVTSGCLSQPEPHYLPYGQSQHGARAWHQGTVVATALANEPDCSFEQVEFDNGRAWFRGQRLCAS